MKTTILLSMYWILEASASTLVSRRRLASSPFSTVSSSRCSSLSTVVMTTETDAPVDQTLRESLEYVTQKVASSLQQLGVSDLTSQPVLDVLENSSLLVTVSMAHEHRLYHRFHHVVDVVQGLARKKQADPVTVLATLFHDVVYAHVDGGLSDDQAELLLERGGIQITSTGFQLVAATKQDSLLQVVAAIFGVTEGQHLSNEFLSAVVATRVLEAVLPRPTLARIAACIEATIPFRIDMPQRLYQNLRRANEEFQLDLSELDLVSTVQQAVQLANEDVANFAYDFDSFIGQTMSLLPETNPSLRSGSPSARDWIEALEKMSKFFDFVRSQRVFHQFQNVPTTVELARHQQAAAANVAQARQYLQAKIEALYEETTAPAPMA